MSQEAFLYLIKQEMKWNRDRSKRNWWSLLYIFVGVSIGLAFFTYAIRTGQFQFQYMWFFTYAFPFVMMGLSYSSIAKEWKNRMYGWWLSLPYSRERLVLSKLIAGWMQMLMIFVFSFGLMVIFSIYVVLLSEDMTFSLMLEHLKGGLPWLFVLCAFYPLVASISYLIFVSKHTKYRAITPLLWMVLIFSINSFFWFSGPFYVEYSNNQVVLFKIDITYETIIAIFSSWLVTWGIFKIVARWLEKKLIL